MDNPIYEPGDVATCAKGKVGLITSVETNFDGFLYRGIHLAPEKFGQPWQSIRPSKIGEVSVFLEEL